MPTLNRSIAENILEKRDIVTPENFVAQVYSLTSHPQLISDSVPLGEKEYLAFTLLLNILRQTSGGRKSGGAEEMAKPNPAGEKGVSVSEASGETVAEATPDYYAVLGIDKNADQQQIRKTYRDLMKKYHPDALRQKGLSDQEMTEAARKAQEINEAYKVLNSPKNKQNYDTLLSQPPIKIPPPSQREIAVPYVTIGFAPTKGISYKPGETDFKEKVGSAGLVEFDTLELGQLRNLLPQGFGPEQLTTALYLYSQGVSAKLLEEKIDKSGVVSKLPEKSAQSLYSIPYLIAAFEEYDPKRSVNLQTPKPELTIKEVSPKTTTQPDRIVFSFQQESFIPFIKNIVGTGVDFAKNEIKKFALDAIKKGGRKLAKEALKAAKKGIKVAANVAVKAGVAATEAGVAAGEAAAGPPGWVLIAAEAVIKAVSVAVKAVVGGIKKLLRAATGEEDTRKVVLAFGVTLLVVGMAIGNTLLAALGAIPALGAGISLLPGGPQVAGGIRAFLGSAGVAIATYGASIATPLAISVLAAPLLVAIFLFIINSGAYIVPQNPYQTAYLQESLYIGVEKTANPTKVDNPPPARTITYSVTITAKQGTLTNITLSDDCKVLSASGTSACPAATIPPPPAFISPTQPYTFSYKRSYGSQYRDAVAIDTLTVTADTPGAPGETATGSSSVIIGKPPTGCFEFQPANAPYISEFQAAAVELSSHTAYAAKLCAAGPITVQLNTSGPVTTGACAGAGANSMFFDNCLYFKTHGQAFITYLFAHESGHTYSKRVGEYSQFVSRGISSEGYLPTYCLRSKASIYEDFAETIGDYVDNGRLRSLCSEPDQRPFNLCSSQFLQHCDFAKNVIFK